jgi:hypothetical protein
MSIRLTTLLMGLATLVAAPAVAAADSAPSAHTSRTRTHVFTARLTPRGADARNYTNASGRSRLTARGRRATITTSVKGMPHRRSFRWAIVTRRCSGARVRHFTYKRLRTNRRGRATAKGHSHRRFALHSKRKRYVVVYTPGTRHKPFLCGRLVRRR